MSRELFAAVFMPLDCPWDTDNPPGSILQCEEELVDALLDFGSSKHGSTLKNLHFSFNVENVDLTRSTAFYLAHFNVGFLIEPRTRSKFSISFFWGSLPNSTVTPFHRTEVFSPFARYSMIDRENLRQWLSTVFLLSQKFWSPMYLKSHKACSEVTETREAPNSLFFINYFLPLIKGTPSNVTKKALIYDRVVWNDQEFCYRRPGAFTVLFQIIDYYTNSSSWQTALKHWLLNNLSFRITKTDYIQAYSHLSNKGVDFNHSAIEILYDEKEKTHSNFPCLINLPSAHPLIYWQHPSVFGTVSTQPGSFDIPTSTIPVRKSSREMLDSLSGKLSFYFSKGLKEPYRFSQYFLSLMKCFREIYENALSQFSLLAEFFIELPELESLKYLQFVSNSDRILFFELFDFLTNLTVRKNKRSFTDFKSSESFQVKVAQQTESMRLALNGAIRRQKSEIASHRNSVLRLKDFQEQRRQTLKGMTCTRKWLPATRHCPGFYSACSHCDLVQELNSRTHKIYENKLPEEDSHRWAVVFDSMVPDSIKDLYDALYCLRFYHEANSETFAKQYGIWSLPGIRRHNHPQLHLDSSVKSFLSSHYGRERHIDEPISEFFMPCGKKVELYCSSFSAYKSKNSNTTNQFCFTGPLLPKIIRSQLVKPYTCLTDFVDFNHNQNDILVKQHVCPPDLSLKTFVAFGSLRAGKRLGFHNTLAAFLNQELDFNHSATHKLLECVWWEIHGDFLQDLENKEFITKIAQAITDFATNVSNTWDKPFNLYSCLLILDKISEVNDLDCLKKPYQVIRDILCGWKSRCTEQFLEHICFLHILSHKRWNNQSIMTVDFLHSLYIYSGILSKSMKTEHLFNRTIVSLAKEEISRDTLDQFVDKTASFDTSCCECHMNQDWYYTDLGRNDGTFRIEFNRTSGVFLINRRTPNKLPNKIRSSCSFELLFGTSFNPTTVVTPLGYRTLEDYNGFVYEFNDDNFIYQVLKSDNNTRWVFIPESLGVTKIPYRISHHLYQWLSNDGILEFRQRVLSPESWEYRMNCNCGLIVNCKNEVVLPQSCPLFNHISLFFPIESIIHIIVTVDSNYNVTNINLYRFNLNFIISNGELVCSTLDMTVNNSNPCSNIYVKQSLFLSNESKKILLVPFGRVSGKEIKIPSDKFSTVVFYLFNYRESLDLFDTDGDQVAWLFLVLLYGMFNTSLQGFHIAIHLLQTMTYPSRVYSDDCLPVLEDIMKLSPERGYYPEHLKVMETIKWPKGLAVPKASDLYALLVNVMLCHNKLLGGKGPFLNESVLFLHYRAYHDHRYLYPDLNERVWAEIAQRLDLCLFELKMEKKLLECAPFSVDNFDSLRSINGINTTDKDHILSCLQNLDWETFDLHSVVLNFADSLLRCSDEEYFYFKNFLRFKSVENLFTQSGYSSLSNYFYSFCVDRTSFSDVSLSRWLPPSHFYISSESHLRIRVQYLLFNGHLNLYERYSHRDEERVVQKYHDIKSCLSFLNTLTRRSPLYLDYYTSNTTIVESHPQTISKTHVHEIKHPWCLLVNEAWSLIKSMGDGCYSNWSQLLEKVLGLKIREEQFMIADHLLGKSISTQTQLHMGEGKTTVIIPLICLGILSVNHIPRINVLKSLFETCTLKYQRVFSLLGLRLALFTCKRQGKKPLSWYSQIIKNSDILITTPESRQSFFLLSKEPQLELDLLDTDAIQDILDESDEILDPRSQLIYPYGNPTQIDGGTLRWLVAEAIVESIRHFYEFPFAHNLSIENQKGVLFFVLDGNTCLHQNINVDWTPDVKQEIVDFALGSIHSHCFTGTTKHIALIFRGLFYYRIIERAFRLRFRVNYGIDSRRKSLMAVPYRAKDVPSIASEFSDVDLAIFLTLLSWYQIGLSFNQFEVVLNELTQSSQYLLKVWTSDEYSFENIVLSDGELLHNIYNKVKFNPALISHFLNTKCFPIFTKQFPTKRCASAWHLVNTDSTRPVVGFSGTNLSKELLPFPTGQDDLDFVLNTNERMDCGIRAQAILNYDGDLLEALVQNPHIQVLLDVGAVVEDTNEIFAKKFLKISTKSAVLFFNDFNNLVVFDGRSIRRYEESVYFGKLQDCLIYLDDYHTRGVDLKFPPGTYAAVTLFKELTRDKLAQGSMRMRKLLCLDQERHHIVYLKPTSVEFENIVEWCTLNSISYVNRSLKTWTKQAISWFNDVEEPDLQSLEELYSDQLTPTPPSFLLQSSNIDDQKVLDFMWKTLSSRHSLEETTIEEELEKELEEELVEERVINRPPPARAHVPRLCQGVKDLAKNRFNLADHAFINMSREILGVDNKNDFCTREFSTIINNAPLDFSRRPSWAVNASSGEIIFISPFEANQLLSLTNKCPVQARDQFGLHLVVPRLSVNGTMFPLSVEVDESLETCPFLNLYLSSVFFASVSAEKLFCQCFGLWPRPRSSAAEEARNRGFISEDGFGTLDGRNHHLFTNSPLNKLKHHLQQLHFHEFIGGSHLHDVLYLMRKSKLSRR
ncbi:hypothetical protein P9112_004403 [Eukaryota sp. TZLM1-RC]